MRILTVGFIILGWAFLGGSEAQPPPTINIQGGLAASGGGPVTGTHAFRVRFFTVAVGGTAIGSATGNATFSDGGRYSITVTPPAAILASNEVYYELAIDTADDGLDPSDTFSNRVQIHSVPFALLAQNANSLGGTPAAGFTNQFLRKDMSDTFSGSKLTINGALDVGTMGASSHDVNIHGASPGSRLFWDASKGAIRSGQATGTQWDDANIGGNSVAMGYNTTASGFGSLAMGQNTMASGFESTAMGRDTISSGYRSTAMGSGTTASGYFSTAMGFGTTANGSGSTAMGYLTTAGQVGATAMGAKTSALGAYCTAAGKYSTASGAYSTAIGESATAIGLVATAIGYGATANAAGATAMGGGTLASGETSTAMGRSTTASGNTSTALGRDTLASGLFSLATGQLSQATAPLSTAMGKSTIASGSASTAMGDSTTASGTGSTAMGAFTTASGNASTAMGAYTTASGRFSTAMGRSIEARGEFAVAVALNNQVNTVVSQNNTMAIMGGKVGIGSVTPTTRLLVEDNVSGFVATFVNRGDVSNREGIVVQGGANDGSFTTNYLLALDGDGDTVGALRNSSGTFSIFDPSDRRLKTDIKDTEVDALAIVEGLRVVDFKRKSNPDGPTIHGFIAQEAQEVFPEMVTQLDEEMLGISKDTLIPILTKAIQDQQRMMTEQKAEYDARIAALAEEVRALRSDIRP